MTGTPAQRPRHPRCGIQWVQRGDLTGHCAACCRTFSSVSGFDLHQSVATGTLVCTDPATMLRGDGSSRFTAFHDAAGALVWRRSDPTPNPFPSGIPSPRSAAPEKRSERDMAELADGERLGVQR